MPTTSKTTKAKELRLPDYTIEEIGLAEWPIVIASKKRPPVNTVEFSEKVGTDPETGEPLERSWKMLGSEDYGLPYLPDLDLFVSILQLAHRYEYQKPIVNTTAHELCALAGITPGGTTYQRMLAGLNRFKFSGYAADRVFHKPGARTPIIGEAWSIISNFRLLPDYQDPDIRDGMPASYLHIDIRFLNRLRNGQQKPLDLVIWRQLGSGLAKPLYRYVHKNLYNKDRYEIGTQKLVSRIGVLTAYNPAQRKRLLRPHIQRLVDCGILHRSSTFEKSQMSHDPEKVIFFPGPEARKTRRKGKRAITPTIEAKQLPESLSAPNLEAVSSAYPTLMAHFSSLNQFQTERARTTRSEREVLRQVLDHADGDLEAAKYIISYALEKWPGMKTIRGVLENGYPEQALGERKQREQRAKESAERRQRDEEYQRAMEARFEEGKRRFLELSEEAQEELMAEHKEKLVRHIKDRTSSSFTPDKIIRIARGAAIKEFVDKELPVGEWMDDWREKHQPNA